MEKKPNWSYENLVEGFDLEALKEEGKQIVNREWFEAPVLDEIVDIVMGLASSLSGKDYYPYQDIIARNILKHFISQTHEVLTVLLSRQSGKSTINGEMTTAAMVILPALAEVYGEKFEPIRRFKTNSKGAGTGGVRIGVFAPILDQAAVIFNMVRGILESETGKQILKELGITMLVSKGDTVTLSNNSRIICKSASEGANIESATHDLVLIDEAQDVKTAVIAKAISPMIANTGGNIIYIGTCGTTKEEFYETIEKNENTQLEDQVQRHFEFDFRFCCTYNKEYRKHIAKELNRYGEHSDWFRMNYKLEWLLERGVFCPPDMMWGTGNYYGKGMMDPMMERRDSDRISRCYAGLDLGKESDSTVLSIIAIDDASPIYTPEGIYYRKNLVNWLEIYGDNYEMQYWEIIEFLRNYNVDRMCIDATSQGDPVADRFMTYLTSVYVEPIKCTEKQNSEMFRLCQQELNAGRMKIPYGPGSKDSQETRKFIHQMEKLEKEYKGQYLKVKHPEVRGAHDDYFSSLCLALWATQEACMPEIEALSSDLFSSGTFQQPRKNDMPYVTFTR